MSGNTYGPTYAVTSRSCGSASPAGVSPLGISSAIDPNLLGPGCFQLFVADAQRLGKHPDLGDRGHEVRVAAPAGQHVHVQMRGHARAGGAPDVDTNVHAVGRVRGAYRAQSTHLRAGQRDER